MNLSFYDGQSITLSQMLDAKEQRVTRQRQAIQQYHLPLISLTLVIPGEIKKSSAADYLFTQALIAINRYLEQQHITIVKQITSTLTTGNEAIIVVDSLATELKNYCIHIEDHHPLGRLWDIDVIDPVTQQSLSRTTTTSPRLCLVCQQLAKNCSRSRNHSVADVLQVMNHIISTYQC
ncbi:MAG: citrate lyase holo-[acyl-carrier protein] synthase [Candidatus Schmidhempelia sp.]|nr:citrate lyase holo-[acyl-carrier protein] synthase [Candidatus Schmidhempelia sp.]